MTAVFATNATGSDQEYLLWLLLHPHGFVLNTESSATSRYFTLHQAGCQTINAAQHEPGAFTQRQYIKVCADELRDLISWGQAQRPHASVEYCGLCNPTPAPSYPAGTPLRPRNT